MFTPPNHDSPVRAPAVTAKFLAPLASAIFAKDHIATLGQQHFYAAIQPGSVGTDHVPAVPESWTWVARGTPLGPTYALDLATFRALAAATVRSDGTFDVVGEHGRLVALEEGGVFTAAIRGWPQPPSASKSVPPPPPPPAAPNEEHVEAEEHVVTAAA